MQLFYVVARTAALAHDDWRSVILTDEAGRVLFRTTRSYAVATPGLTMPGVVDPSRLQQAMATRRPVIGGVAKRPSNHAAVPVRGPVIIDGRLRYGVTAALAPDSVLRILGNQKVAPQWVVSVQDRQGLRVALSKDHDKTVATGMSPSLQALLEPGLLGAPGLPGRSKATNRPRMMAGGVRGVSVRAARRSLILSLPFTPGRRGNSPTSGRRAAPQPPASPSAILVPKNIGDFHAIFLRSLTCLTLCLTP